MIRKRMTDYETNPEILSVKRFVQCRGGTRVDRAWLFERTGCPWRKFHCSSPLDYQRSRLSAQQYCTSCLSPYPSISFINISLPFKVLFFKWCDFLSIFTLSYCNFLKSLAITAVEFLTPGYALFLGVGLFWTGTTKNVYGSCGCSAMLGVRVPETRKRVLGRSVQSGWRLETSYANILFCRTCNQAYQVSRWCLDSFDNSHELFDHWRDNDRHGIF